MPKTLSLFLALCFISCFTNGQTDKISTQIAVQATSLQPKLVEWRRFIHQNPELGNREKNTMEYIAKHLRSLGLEVQTGIAKTGIVALLRGGKPGPVIALRADMDALPIKERVDIPYKSTVTADYQGQEMPVMHACGHDTHISILMGVAQVLSQMKKDIPGTVKFIFQPAEEGPPGDEEGGAPLMVKEGVMDNPKVDAILGLHISSSLEIGKIKYKPGAFMASSDWFHIKIKGKGTHGASPWTGIDPIVIGAQIVNNLQTIVSRREDLTRAPLVITVAKFQGGVRNNIIPEEAILDGTIRTLSSETQKEVHQKIRQVAEQTAAAWGATVEMTIDTKTLVTYNDPALVKMLIPSLESAAGKDNVFEGNWSTGSEDFSYFGEKAPAFFFNLGGMPKGQDPSKAAPHHTPDLYIDDSMLDVGVKAFCQMVFDYGNKSRSNSR